MFNKDKMKNDPMAQMAIGMLGPDCEDLYNKAIDKVDHLFKPPWDWLMGTCDKSCGTKAEMDEAIKYLNYALQLADRIFEFLAKSTVNFDLWKLCPKLVTKKVIEVKCLCGSLTQFPSRFMSVTSPKSGVPAWQQNLMEKM